MHEQAQLGVFDPDDVRQTRAALQSGLGIGYDAEVDLAKSRLKELPAEDRKRLFNERQENGRLRINDPWEIRRLADEASEPTPELRAAVQANGGDELATLRTMMRDKTSIYWRDPRVQARYRKLIERKN